MPNIYQLNKVRISLLFAVFIFSLMIYESGQWGSGLDVINKLIWLLVYVTPLFVAEVFIRKIVNRGLSVRAVVFLVPLLSAFLFCSAHLIRDFGPATAMGVFFGAPIIYAIFLGVDLFFLLIVILSIKPKNNLLKKFIYASIAVFSLMLFIYGILKMARCDFSGCANGDYLIGRAIKSGDPDVCQLADKDGFWSGFFGLAPLVPSNFASYPAIGGVGRDRCYSELAKKTKKLEICSKAGEYSVYCYDNLAVSLNDIAVCNKIKTYQEIDETTKYFRITREECYENFYCQAGRCDVNSNISSYQDAPKDPYYPTMAALTYLLTGDKYKHDWAKSYLLKALEMDRDYFYAKFYLKLTYDHDKFEFPQKKLSYPGIEGDGIFFPVVFDPDLAAGISDKNIYDIENPIREDIVKICGNGKNYWDSYCYMNLALNLRDHSFCDRLTPASMVQNQNIISRETCFGNYFEEAIKREPENPDAFAMLGVVYFKENNFAAAREKLQKAIDLKPDFYKAHYFLGLIYAEEGNDQAAINEYNIVLKLNPGDEDTLKSIKNLKTVKNFPGDE